MIARSVFTLREHLQAHCDNDDRDDDRSTDDRCNFLGAAAARRVVGGVIEFRLHDATPPIDIT